MLPDSSACGARKDGLSLRIQQTPVMSGGLEHDPHRERALNGNDTRSTTCPETDWSSIVLRNSPVFPRCDDKGGDAVGHFLRTGPGRVLRGAAAARQYSDHDVFAFGPAQQEKSLISCL